jgi:hypothetical protein
MAIMLFGWFAQYIRQSAHSAALCHGKQPAAPDPDCLECDGTGWIETEDHGYAPCDCTWSIR